MQRITEFFRQVRQSEKLRLSASTGKAASLIHGCTIHSLVNIHRGGKKNKELQKVRMAGLREKWATGQYLIIDEVSMIGLNMLHQINLNLISAKGAGPGVSFGGVNVILVGDFHQFEPIADSPLYSSTETLMKGMLKKTKAERESILSASSIFNLKFSKTVVILKQQVRAARDPEYRALLQRARLGLCDAKDHQFLLARVNQPIPYPEIFSTRIIVPTNVVQQALNSQLIKKFGAYYRQKVYYFEATDVYPASSPSVSLQRRIASAPASKCNGVPAKLFLTLGVPVILTKNGATSLNITNGSAGTLARIVFDEDEQVDELLQGPDGSFRLNKLPKCLIIKLDQESKFSLPEFPKDCVPIFPATTSFTYAYDVKAPPQQLMGKGRIRKKQTIKVTRKGFAIDLRFSSTAHKCQGETLKSAIIDLDIKLKNINATHSYVPLSRLQDQNGLHILRPFESSVLHCRLPIDLRLFSASAEELDNRTKVEYAGLATSSSSVLDVDSCSEDNVNDS